MPKRPSLAAFSRREHRLVNTAYLHRDWRATVGGESARKNIRFLPIGNRMQPVTGNNGAKCPLDRDSSKMLIRRRRIFPRCLEAARMATTKCTLNASFLSPKCSHLNNGGPALLFVSRGQTISPPSLSHSPLPLPLSLYVCLSLSICL